MNARQLVCGGVLATILALVAALPAAAMGGGAGAPGAEATPPGWQPVVDQGRQAGLDPQRLSRLAVRLHAAGISVPAGRGLLDPVFLAAAEGLPAAPVLAKVEEGVSKGASADAVRAAAEQRAAALSRAHALLASETGAAAAQGTDERLLVASALALESGVSETSLRRVLGRGTGPGGLVVAAIEAGEALHLAGLDPQTVEALMLDCVDKRLRRPEVLRAVRMAVQRSREGLQGGALRDALWGAEPQMRGGPEGGTAPYRGAADGGGPGGMPGGAGPSSGSGGHKGSGGPRGQPR